MKLSFVKPRRELAPYIESMWVFESPVGLPPSEGNIAAPNGCCKITFAYGNSFISIANDKAMVRPPDRINFVGNRDSSIHLQSSRREIGCIGIEFYPHGAFPIFGIDMRETLNFQGDGVAVLGKWARSVEAVLNTLPSVGQRVTFLQEQLVFLARKTQLRPLWRTHQRKNEVVGYCVSALKSADGLMPIRELELTTGYSRRYLDLLFRTHVGLSPKVLAGIFRFQRFYQKWAQGQSFDVIKNDLYEYYFDQSHFTKEFKRMTGHSPREFWDRVSNQFGIHVSRR